MAEEAEREEARVAKIEAEICLQEESRHPVYC